MVYALSREYNPHTIHEPQTQELMSH